MTKNKKTKDEEEKKPVKEQGDGSSKSVDLAIKEIQEKYGDGSIMKLGDARKVDVDVIPTGSISLDLALGVGGIPRGRVIEVYGPESSGKCVRDDTIIFSEHGMLPIRVFGDLHKLEFQKKEVYVYSENCFEKTSHFYNGGLKKTIKVVTSYGYEIEGTPNHRIRVLDKDGGYLFRRLDELQPTDHVAIQRGQNCFGKGFDLSGFAYEIKKNNSRGKRFAKRILDEDLAKLMGYLIGDGDTSGNGFQKNNISMTIADPIIEADFQKLCMRLFSEEAKVTPDRRTKSVKRLVIHNTEGRKFLQYCGLEYGTAGTKLIPWSIMCAPKEIVASFLRTLFECDGCVTGATIEYCSKSKQLTQQVQTVLLNFGITSRVKERFNKKYGTSYQYLYIYGQSDLQKYSQEIGFIHPDAVKKLSAYINKKRRSKAKTNIDILPLNSKLKEFFTFFNSQVRKTNREDWDYISDPLSIKSPHALTYYSLGRILGHFEEGRNLPQYQYLQQIYDLGFFWDRIENTEQSQSHVLDFTVPKNATFTGNGFVNHNTTLCLHLVAEMQKKGGVCAYVDAEHALDPEYAKRIGVKINDLLISQPDTGEQALEIVETLVRSGGVSLVVIDSVAALTPRAEIEGEMDQQHMGLQARLMSHALRKLTAIVSKTGTTVVFINQIRMKIGIMFGNPETTTGGLALKFYASVRIEIRRSAQIQSGEKIVGNRVKVKIVKNKVAAPFRTAEFDIMYNEGISKAADLVNTGVALEVVNKSGAWYNFLPAGKAGGEPIKLGQGMEGARAFLKENPKVEKDIAAAVKTAAAQKEL